MHGPIQKFPEAPCWRLSVTVVPRAYSHESPLLIEQAFRGLGVSEIRPNAPEKIDSVTGLKFAVT
jgi:hypothetical protein